MQIFYAIFCNFSTILSKIIRILQNELDFCPQKANYPAKHPTSSFHINPPHLHINFSFSIRLYISNLRKANINRRIWI